MNVKTLKNEIQLELELNALAQPAVDAARDANAAAGAASSAAARANTAAINAESAVKAANDAAASATSAATDASEQAGKAENAAAEASEAGDEANAAAERANTEAEAASEAASAANAAAATIQSVFDGKADAIMDTSARAASHSLHAQDGPLAVTLYGKTTETGTGDKSPDNPYVISGVDVGQIRASGKNLAKPYSEPSSRGITVEKTADGGMRVFGTATSTAYTGMSVQDMAKFALCEGTYTLSVKSAVNYQVSLNDGNDGSNTLHLGAGNTSITKAIKASDNFRVMVRIPSGETVDFVVHIQLETGSVAHAYESYNANVINPPLLPDGAPLMGNGTVCDTVENDVLSGCDAKITLNGAEDWKLAAAGWFYADFPDVNVVSNTSAEVFSSAMYSNLMTQANPTANGFNVFNWWSSGGLNRFGCRANAATVDEFKALLAPNPLTVYYRSTAYTPDKDLRVCRVERYWINETLDGTESYGQASVVGQDGYYFFRTANKRGISDASSILCESLKSNKEFSASIGGSTSIICNADSTSIPRFYLTHELLGTNKDMTSAECLAAAKEWLVNNPIHLVRQLATPEVYMTDPLPLRKPTGIMPVTVTGSAETAVTYPCDTKSYIDRKFDALAAALLS